LTTKLTPNFDSYFRRCERNRVRRNEVLGQSKGERRGDRCTLKNFRMVAR
jgi:hypothetical protein